jgi:protein TonB
MAPARPVPIAGAEPPPPPLTFFSGRGGARSGAVVPEAIPAPPSPPRDRRTPPQPASLPPVEAPGVAEPTDITAAPGDAADAGGSDTTGDGGPYGTIGGGTDPRPGGGDGSGNGDELGDGADAEDPIPVTLGVTPPELVHRVEPDYPYVARRSGVQGVVVLQCVIDTAGAVRVRSVTSSVPVLDDSARAAVEQWRYRPALVEGRPRAVLVNIRVRFSLR